MLISVFIRYSHSLELKKEPCHCRSTIKGLMRQVETEGDTSLRVKHWCSPTGYCPTNIFSLTMILIARTCLGRSHTVFGLFPPSRSITSGHGMVIPRRQCRCETRCHDVKAIASWWQGVIMNNIDSRGQLKARKPCQSDNITIAAS